MIHRVTEKISKWVGKWKKKNSTYVENGYKEAKQQTVYKEKVSLPDHHLKEEKELEYPIVECEIRPANIICPDCGGITIEGLDYCDKCGGEINYIEQEEELP